MDGHLIGVHGFAAILRFVRWFLTNYLLLDIAEFDISIGILINSVFSSVYGVMVNTIVVDKVLNCNNVL